MTAFKKDEYHRRHPAVLIGLTLLVLTQSRLARADTSNTLTRTVIKLADGVYTIRHRDPFPGYVQGNTTVVIGSREVLVVDTCNTPGAAEQDIAEIKEWTDKPVRYVVNTHWHQDHNVGNAAYRGAFPEVAIIAHGETKAMMDRTSPGFAKEQAKTVEDALKGAQDGLRDNKGPDGKPLSDRLRKRFEGQVAEAPPMLEEVRRFTYLSPTLTFTDELSLDLGDREVLVQHPGRGNTGGDAVVFLPAEKILIAGDLVVHPVLFAFDGYPREWSRTLERLAALNATAIVPGHGEVLHDNKYLLQLRDLFRSVVEQVEKQLRVEPEPDVAEIKKHIDVKALKAAILGADTDDAPFFDYVIGALTEVAYHEAKLR